MSSRPCDDVKVVDSARLQRPVERAGGAGLALQLHDLGHLAPDVRPLRAADQASANSPIGEAGVMG
jgi:hypothetical protein